MTAAPVLETRKAPRHPAGFILPTLHSPQIGASTRGSQVAAFSRRHLTVQKGPRVGKSMTLLKWQRWLVDELLAERPDGLLQHRRGLVGIARQNGKSFTGVPLALWHIFEGGPLGAEAYAAAGDRKQARIIFDVARKQILASEYLSSRAQVYRDAIEVTDRGSIFRVLSSDSRLAQGLSPTLVVFDEVHVQRDRELWDAVTLGTGAREEALIFGITTAGVDTESLAGELYDYGSKVATGEIDDPSFLMAWWQAWNECELTDHEAWLAANPSLFEGITFWEDLEIAARQQHPASFRRYRLNQWVRHGGDGWMDMIAFDRQTTEYPLPPEGATIVASFDGSVDQDATAITIIECDPEDPSAEGNPIAHLYACWEAPPQDSAAAEDWQVPRTEVNAAVDDLFRDYEVNAFVCDPAWWRTEIQEWRALYGDTRVIDWPPTNQRMGPAVSEAYARIKEGKLEIAENATMRRHVANAVVKPLPGGLQTIKKDKPKSTKKIDSAVTLIMALDAYDRYGEPPEPEPPPVLYTW